MGGTASARSEIVLRGVFIGAYGMGRQAPRRFAGRMKTRRLAFGDIRDAVRLLFCDEVNPRMLRNMNLFAVSEIKRPKGGGMEIRFFDRIEALRLLSELESAGGGADELLRAIEQGAAALGKRDGEAP